MRQRLPFFLRTPAFGYIHHGPYEFDHIAGWAGNRVANDVDVSDFAAQMHYSIAMVEICLFADCYPEVFFRSGPVVGMDALLEFFKTRRPPCGIESR